MDVKRIQKLEADMLALVREFEDESGFTAYMLCVTNDSTSRRAVSIDAIIRPCYNLPFEEDTK